VRVSLEGLLTDPRYGDGVFGGGHGLPERVVELLNNDPDT
jgi:hypothetical protein